MAPNKIDPLPDIELLTEIVRALVDYPEDVKVVEQGAGTDTSIFLVHTAASDRGKIIGKGGVTISSLRSLFGRIAAVDRRRVFIEVADSKQIK